MRGAVSAALALDTMATSVPQQKAPPGWAGAPSPQHGGTGSTNALEIGMSGMSLESTLSGGSRPPALSGSSVSTTGDAYAPSNMEHSEQSMGMAPPSPASPLEPQPAVSQGSTRPPGIGVSLPSPIGKGSTASNTNSSSPHLSLTPPSSVDGNIDIFGVGKHMSPYYEGMSLPTPPNLDQSSESFRNQHGSRSSWGELQVSKTEKDGRRGSENNDFLQGNFVDNDSLSGSFGGGLFSTGSFDPVEQDDGLRGLGALRDRSHSSPGPFVSLSGQGSGPYSSSPVLYRDSSPGRGDGSVGSREEYTATRTMQADQRRARTMSRDNNSKASSRPPLSGGFASAGFAPSQEGGPSLNKQHGLHSSGFGVEGQQQHGYGSIPRPDLRYSTSDFVSDKMNGNRGRSMSLGASSVGDYGEHARPVRDPYNEAYQHQMEQLHVQKFASPHSLNTHIQQQRMPPHVHHMQQMQPQQQSRHVRSFSQPGPLQHAGTSGYSHGHEDVMRYGLSQHQNGGEDRRNHSGGSQQRHLFEGDSTSSLEGSRYGRGSHIARSVSAGANLTQGGGAGLIARSGNLSQPSLPVSAYDGHSIGKPSFQAHVSQNNVPGGTAMYSGHGSQGRHQLPNAHQRVDSSDFQGGRSARYDDSGVPVMATPEEMRIHGIGGQDGDRHAHSSGSLRHERLVSPSHSPLNMTVGGHPGHMRHYSDGTAMSASPISIGSMRGGHPANYGQNPNPHSSHLGLSGSIMSDAHHQRSSSFDDDLTHPLVGEHIDDPEDDLGASASHGVTGGVAHHGSMPASYGGDGAFHAPQKGVPRASSFEQVPPIVTHYNTMEPIHHHHHHSSSSAPGPKVVYNVKFKRTQRCFIKSQRITRDLKIGCYVKVEADRGEDLGIVVSKVSAEKYNATCRSGFRGGVGSNSSGELTAGALGPSGGVGSAGAADLKRIIRLATHDEVSLLAVKREEEEELLKICRSKVRQRSLPMHVVDAEYQFDRHKLTFFFEAEGRIDFRELVRDLFSMYKTRIWMQQLDKNCSGSAVGGAGVVTPSSASLESGNPASSREEVLESDMIVR